MKIENENELPPVITSRRRLSAQTTGRPIQTNTPFESRSDRSWRGPSRSFSSCFVHGFFFALGICAVVGVGTATLAGHAVKGQVKITQLSQREIVEKLDGEAASATVNEVTFKPGQEDLSHRHAGPVFGYVLEGEYEHALNDEPARTYKAGETFYEPSGSLHRVARNPSGKSRTRLLAVIVHSRDAREVTIPQKGKE